MIINTGDRPINSRNKLLTTICYRLNGESTYALEGSIFVSGAIVQWLRDGLKIIKKSNETEYLAKALEDNNGVYMVPALTGLGAPHWAPNARGAVYGITRNTGPADFARAALESVAYQTKDLFSAISRDGIEVLAVRVDGGMTSNDWLMQFVADVTDLPVERPIVKESTALGAAMLALMQSDPSIDIKTLSKKWTLDKRFLPSMTQQKRADLLKGWEAAVKRTILDS